MNTTRPEADIEYSRGHGALNGDSAPPLGPPGGRPRRHSSTIRWGLLAGGLSGAALLAVAEFTPLFTIHTLAGQTAIKTVQTGSHDSYALLPVALLAALLSLEVWRTRARLALVATGVLGVVALLIALLRRPTRRARDRARGQRGDRLEERQLEPRRRALSGDARGGRTPHHRCLRPAAARPARPLQPIARGWLRAGPGRRQAQPSWRLKPAERQRGKTLIPFRSAY